MFPELAAATHSTQQIADALREYGCVLVRGIIPLPIVEKAHRRMHEAFMLREEQFRTNTLPSDFDRGLIGYGNVLISDLDQPESRIYSGLMELVAYSGMVPILKDYFADQLAFPLHLCLPRRQGVNCIAQPTPFHQDASFYEAFLEGTYHLVNAWVPLMPCGRDAPALEFLPRKLDEMLDPERRADDDFYGAIHLPEREIYARFGGRDAFWRPEFQPGDILFMTSNTVHRTHQLPTMQRTRYSIEVRSVAASAGIDRSKCLIIK